MKLLTLFMHHTGLLHCVPPFFHIAIQPIYHKQSCYSRHSLTRHCPKTWPFVPFQCFINISLVFQLPREFPEGTMKHLQTICLQRSLNGSNTILLHFQHTLSPLGHSIIHYYKVLSVKALLSRVCAPGNNRRHASKDTN